MPSHMSVQKTAIKRNALSEIFIDYVIQTFAKKMFDEGYTTAFTVPERQKAFTRDDCQDVYDHYIELPLSSKLDTECKTLEIWAQTTCYKGNTTGKPESNKTYEIRETLSEALTLRKWLLQESSPFRTIHFTLGPANYTYGWFKTVKENAFDLSLYPVVDTKYDFFSLLSELGADMIFEFEMYEKLDELLETPDHPLTRFINNTVNTLISYFTNGYCQCETANKQAFLLKSIY